MEDKISFCPTCGEGTLGLEEIEESSSDECIKTCYYSCGHKHTKISISTTILVKAGLTKTVSRTGDKKSAGKHQAHEIEERYKENDKDCHGRLTLEFIYINHKDTPTSVFHVVKYRDSNELKHVDCKYCGNSWKSDSRLPFEDFFSFEFIPEISYPSSFKIQCLKCSAKYEVIK
ncbi:MAG: hypothetical protein PHW22_01195 [Bacilli bacterium]|nr:hypothetical protein [Bacilli bacterium]